MHNSRSSSWNGSSSGRERRRKEVEVEEEVVGEVIGGKKNIILPQD